MLQLPPDSQAAILSQTLPDATLGAEDPELEPDDLEDEDERVTLGALGGFGALVPTRTTWVRGFVVTLLEVCLRLVSLPSWRTSRKVIVRLPARPVVSIVVLPRASDPLFLRTVLKAMACFRLTNFASTLA